eukprot:UN19166
MKKLLHLGYSSDDFEMEGDTSHIGSSDFLSRKFALAQK